jgi:hypothetical protein
VKRNAKQFNNYDKKHYEGPIGRDHILSMATPEEPMERWPINELEYQERDNYPGESQS